MAVGQGGERPAQAGHDFERGHPHPGGPCRKGRATTLYVGATRGTYRSQDSCETVSPLGERLVNVSVTSLLLDPSDARVIYVGTAYSGLFRSTDGGSTWHSLRPDELTEGIIEALEWSPDGEIVAASERAVWTARPQ